MTPAAPCPDCGAAMQDRGAGLECPACGHVQGWEPIAAPPCPGCATRSTDGADHTCYRTCPECGAPLDDQGDFRQHFHRLYPVFTLSPMNNYQHIEWLKQCVARLSGEDLRSIRQASSLYQKSLMVTLVRWADEALTEEQKEGNAP